MIEKLTETTIREALLKHLREKSNDVVLEEVKIEGGAARIDVASFGREIVGYEIKSDFDKIDRMSNQIHAYNRAFNKINLVCGARFLDYALAVMPAWWGIIQVSLCDGHPKLQKIRDASPHDRQDPYSVASLLSRENAVELLRLYSRPVRSKSNLRTIWETMAASIPLREIEGAIIHNLFNPPTSNMMPLFDGH